MEEGILFGLEEFCGDRPCDGFNGLEITAVQEDTVPETSALKGAIQNLNCAAFADRFWE
jgi:hypothetical protein